MTEHDDSKPPLQPLDYGRADRGEFGKTAGIVLFGMVCAALVLLASGCTVFLALNYPIAGPTMPNRPPPPKGPPIAYGILAFAAVPALVPILRTRPRRWFVVGLLLGTGIVSLLEGACFMNP